MDGYRWQTGFPLSEDDQLTYDRRLAELARSLSMSPGLVGDLPQAAALAPDFDFAVNAECVRYGECDPLRAFTAAGKPVLHAEYDETDVDFCPLTAELGFASIRKHRWLDAWREPCPSGPGPEPVPDGDGDGPGLEPADGSPGLEPADGEPGPGGDGDGPGVPQRPARLVSATPTGGRLHADPAGRGSTPGDQPAQHPRSAQLPDPSSMPDRLNPRAATAADGPRRSVGTAPGSNTFFRAIPESHKNDSPV
ncbi:endo alpha-1,4 polygalactosaminidase [Plantactinospora sp. KBS50]|uniref:endo alpha-1,4 polygalactosaminidase n=1 Tax=Plantactinospora sp. KBS50 TaxID=2024580 RepID=UPI0018E05972|nr:endo alpha-1,4 polygalactosaminidase [Plantactinospora sp. KBS50]